MGSEEFPLDISVSLNDFDQLIYHVNSKTIVNVVGNGLTLEAAFEDFRKELLSKKNRDDI
jgi:hypothetical protein